MKLGGALCKDFFPKPSDLVNAYCEHGIKVIELTYDSRYVSQEVKSIRGFDIDLSMHCPISLRLRHCLWNFVLNPKFYYNKYEVKEIEKGFQVAEKLDATHYVMHGGVFPRGYFRFKRFCDRKDFLKEFVRTFEPLFINGKDSNVKIVLENLDFGNLFSEASDIKYIQEKFPWLGFCLDFGHSELTGQTRLLKDMKIDHVHVSDNNSKKDLHLPLGKGKLNFYKLLKVLKIPEFDGKIIVECKSISGIVTSINVFNKKILR